jgi:tripartite-type tricarboxylate transporter receptor subunit TctC
MLTQRRHFVQVTGAAILAAPMLAKAQSWPSKPIRLVVPFPPGGLIDNMARLIGPVMAKELEQPVVIDNKPGAGGTIGAADVAKSAADGYSLLMASAPLTISPALYPTLPYRPEQIKPLGLIGSVPNVLLVNAKSGINSVADLIARAKKTPGKLNYASNGNGTSLHLSAELLKITTGTFITHIPYRGTAAALTGLIAGEIDMMFENLPPALTHIQAGTLKALAVTTRRRSNTIPNVSTLAELGMKDFEVSAWYGLAAPAGLDAAISSKLESVVEKIANNAEIRKAMQSRGADVSFLNAGFTSAFMAADTTRWKRVAAFSKISLG